MGYSEKENRQAIIKKYLSDHPYASLRDLGKLLGISRQRVHIILKGMDLKNAGIDKWRKLTAHQVDILKQVARGHTDKQIAEFMGCSAQSIRNQLQVIYAKLNVHNRKGAVQLAIKKRLLPKSVVSPEY